MTTERTGPPTSVFPEGIYFYPAASWRYRTWQVDLVAPPKIAALGWDMSDCSVALRVATEWGKALNLPVWEGKRDNRCILPYTWKPTDD